MSDQAYLKSYWRFQLHRITGLLRALMKNRMSAIGLIILILSGVVAVAAPLLTPYKDLQQVSGPSAQPDWVTSFPDGYYLSKNFVVVKDSSFSSPGAVQALVLTGSQLDLSSVAVSYDAGRTDTSTHGIGSMQLSHPTQGIATAVVNQSFLYPYRGPPASLLATSWGLLGTDAAGSDLLTRDLYGTGPSMLVGLTAALLGIGVGLIIGLLAGLLGGLVDQVLMRITDLFLTIPFLPLAIILVVVLTASALVIIAIIAFFSWMGFARVIRSQVLTLRERPFIEAARAAGAGNGRILSRHLFPNLIGLTYVNLALSVPGAILTYAALAFLGLGDPTVESWGRILNDNFIVTGTADWWWVIPPGFAIAIVSLSFVLIGYSLDEMFNPKLRRRQ